MKRFTLIVEREVFESCTVMAETKEQAKEMYHNGTAGNGEPEGGEWELNEYGDHSELLSIEEVS